MDELARIIPVRPPIVNSKTKPIDHNNGVSQVIFDPCRVDIQLNTFIPVGTAIIIVAAVKYARVSTSIPIVNI